jgi:hypothetical protein
VYHAFQDARLRLDSSLVVLKKHVMKEVGARTKTHEHHMTCNGTREEFVSGKTIPGFHSHWKWQSEAPDSV